MTKPTLQKSKKTKWRQGKYHPLHPEKYLGNSTNIVFRSSWEYSLAKWLDTNPSVKKWGSEEAIVKYISPIDGKEHRYYIDFYAEILNKYGIIDKYLIEVKPFSQTKPPKVKKRRGVITEAYKTELSTYYINLSKWKAASEVAARNGMKFIVLTEKELFGR